MVRACLASVKSQYMVQRLCMESQSVTVWASEELAESGSDINVVAAGSAFRCDPEKPRIELRCAVLLTYFFFLRVIEKGDKLVTMYCTYTGSRMLL